eukprot:7347364-Lingulodinium_polyedra.AAC.1
MSHEPSAISRGLSVATATSTSNSNSNSNSNQQQSSPPESLAVSAQEPLLCIGAPAQPRRLR